MTLVGAVELEGEGLVNGEFPTITFSLNGSRSSGSIKLTYAAFYDADGSVWQRRKRRRRLALQ